MTLRVDAKGQSYSLSKGTEGKASRQARAPVEGLSPEKGSVAQNAVL